MKLKKSTFYKTLFSKEIDDVNSPVVVISYSISTALGLIRSLGQAGYEVDLFSVVRNPKDSRITASSAFIRNSIEFVGRDDPAIVAQLIKLYEREPEKCVLFPADDYCAFLVDQYRDVLASCFFMPYIIGEGKGALTRLMDKTVQSKIAEQCGFLVPKEWIILLQDRDIAIPENMIFPCFVKPLISVGGRKAEMEICSNETELKIKLDSMKIKDQDRSVLVQEFLQISQEYSMSGVCIDQRIILPAIVKKHRIARFRRGTTLLGELVPLEDIEPVKTAIFAFLREIHYVGMFDLEVFLANESLYFGELNLRSGGPHYAYFASGINLPEKAVRAIKGEDIGSDSEIKLHSVFLNDQNAWDDYLHGCISKNEMKQLYKKADILLLDIKDDPNPGKLFKRKAHFKEIKLSIKKVLGLIQHEQD